MFDTTQSECDMKINSDIRFRSAVQNRHAEISFLDWMRKTS